MSKSIKHWQIFLHIPQEPLNIVFSLIFIINSEKKSKIVLIILLQQKLNLYHLKVFTSTQCLY